MTTRQEVLNVLSFIEDSLRSEEIVHFTEVVKENVNTWSCGAYDKNNYLNFGMIGWDEEKGAVIYYAYNPIVANHGEMEGVPDDENNCWWCPTHAEMFIQFLKGELRSILAPGYQENPKI